MISMTDGNGGISTYTYDGAVPVSFTDGEGNIYTYAYDEMNRQLTAIDPLGHMTAVEYDRKGRRISETTEVTDAMGGEYTYEYDAESNAVSITMPDGDKVSTEYDANGQMTSSTDEYTGLEYLRARYYNADKGRFFQENTYLGDITDPLTLNRYTYTQNSPLNYIDPSGHILNLVAGAAASATKIAASSILKTEEYTAKKAVKEVVTTTAKWTVGAAAGYGIGKAAGTAASMAAGTKVGQSIINSSAGKAAASVAGKVGSAIKSASTKVEAAYQTTAISQYTGSLSKSVGGVLDQAAGAINHVAGKLGTAISGAIQNQVAQAVQNKEATICDEFKTLSESGRIPRPGDDNFIGPLTNSDNHFIRGDGIGAKKRGVLGAHNMSYFDSTLESTGFPLEDLKVGPPTPHPTIEGIYAQQYRVPAHDGRGNFIGFKNIPDPKTIYDPAIISNRQMLDWGQEAMQNGVITGRIIEGTASNGLQFRGFIEDGSVTNFFPVLPQ